MTIKIVHNDEVTEFSFSPFDVVVVLGVSWMIIFLAVLGAVIASRGLI